MLKNVVFDVDGVFTDGTFTYDKSGKVYKNFGPNDSDGIRFLKKNDLNVLAISADKRGFPITEKRMTDIGLPCRLVGGSSRVQWMQKHEFISDTAFMGDGPYDTLVMQWVSYSIAPSNALDIVKQHANFVTSAPGGHGAVYEACVHICKRFFNQTEAQLLDL